MRLLLVPFLAGCLSSNYSLPSAELHRLAHVPAADRGRSVEVHQDLSLHRDPAPIDQSPRADDEVWVSTVLVGGGRWHQPHHHHHHHGGDGGRPGRRSPEGDDEEGDDDSGSRSAHAAAAVVIVAGSVIAAGVLGATEGARYDGTVAVSPDHPLHLRGEDGQEAWIPLNKLSPQIASWAASARLSEDDGELYRLARQPLNRRGFTYALDFQAGRSATADGPGSLAFGTRTSFGYFPHHKFGLLVGLGIQFTNQSLEWRPHAELQAYPFSIGRAHFGLYGQAGYSFGVDMIDNPTAPAADSAFAGGGAILQLDVSTRFAVTLRGGVNVMIDPAHVSPEVMLGLAIF